ncbi:Phage gp6-like head-tail connector protein [compost metagenome]
MSLPTVADLKRHLRLEPEPDTAADAELEGFLAAGLDHAEQYLQRSLPWLDETTSPPIEVPVPASVRLAVLMVAADLYENREAQIIGVSRVDNPTVARLLNLYRTGLGV